jgi:hypothetical protein
MQFPTLRAKQHSVSVSTKTRFAIVFLMILALGLPLSFPAEDIPETAYDESEALPYEGTPLFSIEMPPLAARTTEKVQSSLNPESGVPSLFAAARVHDTDAHQSADARTSLTLLCTLRAWARDGHRPPNL